MHFKPSSTVETSFELNVELQINTQQNLFYEAQTYKSHENIAIPCKIFRGGLSGLEAIIKYLKEEQKLSYAEISKIINRDQRTVWTTYNKNKKKKTEKIKEKITRKNISFNTSILQERKLSVLESVAQYLKDSGLSVKEISEELGRDRQTIWTVLRRAKEKNKQSEVEQ
jgi:DNA-binding CsgD family transcriptional regulator